MFEIAPVDVAHLCKVKICCFPLSTSVGTVTWGRMFTIRANDWYLKRTLRTFVETPKTHCLSLANLSTLEVGVCPSQNSVSEMVLSKYYSYE